MLRALPAARSLLAGALSSESSELLACFEKKEVVEKRPPSQAAVSAPIIKQSFMNGLFGSHSRSSGQIMIDTNSFVGTEEYIAPEVIKGSGQVCLLSSSTAGARCLRRLQQHGYAV